MNNRTVHSFKSPAEFQKHTLDFYLKNEAINCIPLGIIDHLVHAAEPRWKKHYLRCIEDLASQIHGAYIMTPPFALLLSQIEPNDIPMLMDDISRFEDKPTSVASSERVCDLFADDWSKYTNATAKTSMLQGIFQLNKLKPPHKTDGHCTLATEEHKADIIRMNIGFARDCGMNVDEKALSQSALRAIQDKERYIWLNANNQIVAMAGMQGDTPNGKRVSYVYTHKEYRGHGYASNIVAALSQKILDSGKKFCFLYTDLNNPTSNGIYKKLGYQQIARSKIIDFNYQ